MISRAGLVLSFPQTKKHQDGIEAEEGGFRKVKEER